MLYSVHHWPPGGMGVYFVSTGTAPLPKHAQLGVDGFELFFVFLRISFLEGAPLRGRLQSCHMKSAGGGVASVGRLTCLCTSEEGGVARRGEGSPREGRSGSNERQVKKCQALNPTVCIFLDFCAFGPFQVAILGQPFWQLVALVELAM